MVSPLIPTERPMKSPGAPSDAVSLAVGFMSAHPLAGFTNTYAVPRKLLELKRLKTGWEGAPTTIVSPLIDTALPSFAYAPSDAVSLAVWVMLLHPLAGRTNT